MIRNYLESFWKMAGLSINLGINGKFRYLSIRDRENKDIAFLPAISELDTYNHLYSDLLRFTALLCSGNLGGEIDAQNQSFTA